MPERENKSGKRNVQEKRGGQTAPNKSVKPKPNPPRDRPGDTNKKT